MLLGISACLYYEQQTQQVISRVLRKVWEGNRKNGALGQLKNEEAFVV